MLQRKKEEEEERKEVIQMVWKGLGISFIAWTGWEGGCFV
jgi:hypothetical protein